MHAEEKRDSPPSTHYSFSPVRFKTRKRRRKRRREGTDQGKGERGRAAAVPGPPATSSTVEMNSRGVFSSRLN